MPKYIKPINLRDPKISKAFYNGDLVLQSGQWIDIHGDGDYSRFISIKNGVVNAVHSNGKSKCFNKRFLFRARMNRLQKQYDLGLIDHKEFRDFANSFNK